MTISQLVVKLDYIQRAYGDFAVRVDLASETMQKAIHIGQILCATFSHEDNKPALVCFLQDDILAKAKPTSMIIHQLVHWHKLIGDVDVRLDLGFHASGICYEIDDVLVCDFPNEEQKQAVVLFSHTARRKVHVVLSNSDFKLN